MFVCGKFVATSFDFFLSRSLLCCVCKVHTKKLHLSENELINVEPNRILGTDMPRSKYLDNNYSRRLQRDTANSLPPKTKFHFQLKLASSIASTCEVDPRPTYFRPNIRTKWNVKILISRRLPFRRCTWFANLVSFFSNENVQLQLFSHTFLHFTPFYVSCSNLSKNRFCPPKYFLSTCLFSPLKKVQLSTNLPT